MFEKYETREFSGVACDAHEGHHVVAEGYIVEVLRDGGPAKPGETGEVASVDFGNIQCRVQAIIIWATGAYVPGTFF